jgi:hypothetical protein
MFCLKVVIKNMKVTFTNYVFTCTRRCMVVALVGTWTIRFMIFHILESVFELLILWEIILELMGTEIYQIFLECF